ncbi:hypothetical protein PROSTU_00777 [Providencia stuartii ATCC 25827]|uniref:Uncharacterized protein n=1 Tax=Providencia stuartii ATCC 25827 TaxID=471874 RepID=A0AA87CSR8_PROST|nr:hypothetical protein PROSTU_00895 [Providencia stuartii ATCC 25827]EDU61216.1 hypothetical protein PROSTU_00777 [Providencia stuartii ATCC 25827]
MASISRSLWDKGELLDYSYQSIRLPKQQKALNINSLIYYQFIFHTTKHYISF